MTSKRILLIPLLAVMAFAQAGNGLGSEMARLHIHTALLIPSQAVDEFPVWSPDSRFLAANVEGKWFKLDTSKVQLQEATWHGQRIGAVGSKPKLQSLTSQEAAEWAKQVQHGGSNVTGESGVRAEM